MQNPISPAPGATSEDAEKTEMQDNYTLFLDLKFRGRQRAEGVST